MYNKEHEFGYSYRSIGLKIRRRKQEKFEVTFIGLPLSGNIFAAVTAPFGNLLQNSFGCLRCDTVRHVVAGACARVASQVIIHPLDTIKTRQQVQFPNQQLQNWRIVVSKSCRVGSIKLPRMLTPLLKGDAWLGLWGSIIGTLPVGLVYYSVYENVCSRWKNEAVGAGTIHLLAAATGGLVSDMFRVPADTIRHRVQAYLHPTVFHAAQEILQKDGLSGFYRGFTPTLMRDIPELAITFGAYEALRTYFTGKDGKKLPTWQHLLLGGLSGAIAGIITNPLDVVKCSIQTASKSIPLNVMLPELVQQQGIGFFVAGMGPRVAQLALQNACMFVMFEYLKFLLKPDQMREPDDRNLSWKLTGKRRTHIWKRQFAGQ